MTRPYTFRALSIAACTVALLPASASHLCGGEIYYNLQAGGTCQLEVHVYAESTANGSAIMLDPGDGSIVTLSLSDIDTLPGYCCNYRLEYTGVHTFVGPGSYTLQTELSTRSGDLVNIPNPTSQSVCLSAVLVMPDLNTANTSVRFTTPQSESFYFGNTLVHAVNAYDADGDSLSFDLGVPYGTNCSVMNPYFLPHEIGAGTDTSWIDAASGTFNFQDPFIVGAHNLLIRCWEWRNGALLGRVQRDMKLCVNTLTGISPSPGALNVRLLPTATPGVFQVDGNDQTGRQHWIIDAHGAIARQGMLPPSGGLLDLRTLAAGVYMVRMSGTESPAAQRIVLTR